MSNNIINAPATIISISGDGENILGFRQAKTFCFLQNHGPSIFVNDHVTVLMFQKEKDQKKETIK